MIKNVKNDKINELRFIRKLLDGSYNITNSLNLSREVLRSLKNIGNNYYRDFKLLLNLPNIGLYISYINEKNLETINKTIEYNSLIKIERNNDVLNNMVIKYIDYLNNKIKDFEEIFKECINGYNIKI